MTIATKTNVSVHCEGPVVVLRIGHGEARLKYRTALRVAQYLRVYSREAKRNAQDCTRFKPQLEFKQEVMPLASWFKRLIGMRPVEAAKPGKRIKAEVKGETVNLWLGNTCFGLHYNNALQLTEWLRTRAREAKNFAGDKSKEISVVGTLHNATPD